MYDLEQAYEGLRQALREFEERFCSMVDLLEEMGDILYKPIEPIPKTPYLFKVKVWIYDKRPKQYHIRNNCKVKIEEQVVYYKILNWLKSEVEETDGEGK